MLENWEIKALLNYVSDYQKWAEHAVSEGIYTDEESALKSKALKCANRMIAKYESNNESFDDTKTYSDKIDVITTMPAYKDRAVRDAEQVAEMEAASLAVSQNAEEAAVIAEAEFQAKIDAAVAIALNKL